MRSRAAASLLALAFAFLVLGLLSRRWELVSLVIPVLVFLFLDRFLNRSPIVRLEAQRTLDTQKSLEGDLVRVSVRIENKGEAIDFAYLVDALPEGFEVAEGSNVFQLRLEEKAVSEFDYAVRTPRRGRHRWAELQLHWTDPALTGQVDQTIPCISEVQVMPRMQDLRKCDISPRKVRIHVGNIPSPMLGPGIDFYGIRSYADGDSLRQINWKATARRDQLLTNDYRTERSGDAVIVLDARAEFPESEAADRMVDGCVDAAASIAGSMLRQRNRVGLIVMGEFMDVVKLAPGKRQFYSIMDALLRTRPGVSRSQIGLKLALERYFPESAMLVVISPLQDPRTLRSLEDMASMRREMIVVSPSPLRIEADLVPDGPLKDLALRAEREKRHELMGGVGRFCRVVDWEIGTALAPSLLGVRGSRERSRP